MAINKKLELTEYVRRPSTEHGRLYNFTLTGHYTDDEAFVEGVRALVEKLGGEFDFNYAHKANHGHSADCIWSCSSMRPMLLTHLFSTPGF